jgi:hypothetical protein
MTASGGDGGYPLRTPLYGGFSQNDLVEHPAIEIDVKRRRRRSMIEPERATPTPIALWTP